MQQHQPLIWNFWWFIALILHLHLCFNICEKHQLNVCKEEQAALWDIVLFQSVKIFVDK